MLTDPIRTVLVLLGSSLTAGCSLLGPSCLERQNRGPALTFSGVVDKGEVVVREAQYAIEGSQNDLDIKWADQHAADGPRLHVYATRLECVDYLNSSHGYGEPCANIGSIGSNALPGARPCVISGACQPEADELVQVSLTITNGRGNPDVLGPAATYKLWVVGDPTRATSYSITGTWFYGPDC